MVGIGIISGGRLGPGVVGELVNRGGGVIVTEVQDWLGPTVGRQLRPGVVDSGVVGARCGGWWGGQGLRVVH